MICQSSISGACRKIERMSKEIKQGENQTSSPSNPKGDDLDELLDSALEDFDRPLITEATPHIPLQDGSHLPAALDGPSSASASSAPPAAATATTTSSQNLPQSQEDLFNELFNASMPADTQKQMEEMMKSLLGTTTDAQPFEQFAQTAMSEPGSSAELNATLEQTLGSLAENTEKLQSEVSEDDLMKMMSGMGLGGVGVGEGGDFDFMPMMQNMMQNLLSKDVLYPSLKEITEKYPAWLTDNESKIPKEDYDRYSKQNMLMTRIVHEFDKEKDTDLDDVKKARFDGILDAMQEMQELGQPPKDIVGELPAGINLDAAGMPTLPGAPDQCLLM